MEHFALRVHSRDRVINIRVLRFPLAYLAQPPTVSSIIASQNSLHEQLIKEIYVRALGIKHDRRLATWFKHPMEFPDGFLGIFSVMKDTERIDNIETIIFKWQILGVTLDGTSVSLPHEFQLSLRRDDSVNCNIQRNHLRAMSLEQG